MTIVLPVMLVLLGAGAKPAPIDIGAHASIYFSSAQTTDQVDATIQGARCESAVFHLAVKNQSMLLFERTVPLAHLVPCDLFESAPAKARQAAIHVVNQAVIPARAVDRSCSVMPGCWTSSILSLLKERDAPLLCFTTGAETSSCIGIDPETSAAVEVWKRAE